MLDKKHTKKKEMKSYKIITILLCFLSVILISQSVNAHSPSSMNLNYDSETQDLEVTITHQVSNPNSHYIYNIEIRKNGETYETFDYTSQPNSLSFTYNYDVNATIDDVIKVTTLCIQGGTITKQITVTSNEIVDDEENGDGETTTPGFELIIAILGIILLLILKRKKK